MKSFLQHLKETSWNETPRIAPHKDQGISDDWFDHKDTLTVRPTDPYGKTGVPIIKREQKFARVADHDGIIQTANGPADYKRGEHFIVQNGPQNFDVMSRDQFNKNYIVPDEKRTIEHTRPSLKLFEPDSLK